VEKLWVYNLSRDSENNKKNKAGYLFRVFIRRGPSTVKRLVVPIEDSVCEYHSYNIIGQSYFFRWRKLKRLSLDDADDDNERRMKGLMSRYECVRV
jgi:hypothetical protein